MWEMFVDRMLLLSTYFRGSERDYSEVGTLEQNQVYVFETKTLYIHICSLRKYSKKCNFYKLKNEIPFNTGQTYNLS